MAKAVDSDFLDSDVVISRILCEEAAVGRVVAIKVDCAHTEGTKYTKSFDSLGANTAVIW